MSVFLRKQAPAPVAPAQVALVYNQGGLSLTVGGLSLTVGVLFLIWRSVVILI